MIRIIIVVMSQVSGRKLSPKVEDEMFRVLRQSLVDCSSEKESDLFLDALLSDTEKIMLAKRLAIMVMLARGTHYTHIAEALKVTSGTIAKISSWDTLKSKPVSRIVSKVESNAKAKAFFDSLIKGIGEIFTLRRKVYKKSRII